KDIGGKVKIGDLARMPHLLIAGATGSGQSVCINSIVACLLTQFTPDELQLIMIDPKMVELASFNGVPHLRLPVVVERQRVVGTERLSVGVLTGLIKPNFPTRIAFAVTSQVDSRVILDMVGAERLLGRGDMLYLPPDSSKPMRLQGTYVSDDEIESLVSYWRNLGTPQYDESDLAEVESLGRPADSDADDLF